MNKKLKKRRPIRWGRVLLLPLLVCIVVFSIMFAYKNNNDNYLRTVNEQIIQLQQQLKDYLDTHKNDKFVNSIVLEADQLAAHFDYSSALATLKKHSEIQSNPLIKQKTTLYQKASDSLVPYTAQVRHLFFHDLIIYPQIAFGPTSHDSAGYQQWNITVHEFEGIIQQMYERGYMLVDFYDVYEVKNGIYTRKVLKLPVGKIPFLLSVDDVAYPDPKPVDGFARGMTVKDNEIYTRVITKDGEILTKDGDIVPILEGFIAKHPDFSFKKARGILALSGSNGTFGYRLINNDEVQAAKTLATALKSKGWIFACHSYGHQAGSYYSTTSDPVKISEDLTKWKTKIGSIVGNTALFVSPFGIKLTKESLQVVKDFGYNAYFIIDRRGDSVVREGMTFLARVDIDGVSMSKDETYLSEYFFNVRSILDINRP